MTKEEIKAKFAKELDDAELDEVAGGTLNESADDLYRLFEMGESGAADASEIAASHKLDTRRNQIKFQNALKAAFRKRGIVVDYSLDKPNVYSDGEQTTGEGRIGEKRVSREEFWRINLDPENYDWK